MKKMLFLFNPRSGKEQIKGHLLRILDIFSKAGYDIRVHVTQCSKDAQKTVEHQGKNVDVIVCSGGDGTLNETISGMLKLKKTPLLGYIPAGSTNDFASSLKIPKNMEKAAQSIVTGVPALWMRDSSVWTGVLFILQLLGHLQKYLTRPLRIRRIFWDIRHIC